jgi:Ca2+-dependent lipid-binding protein
MKVEISLFATKLKNVAGFGKGTSDPYAVVTLGEASLGKTEVCKNSLNPMWITRFVTEYTKELESTLSVNLFDDVSKGKDKPMGSATFNLTEVMGSSGHVKVADLKPQGQLYVRVLEIAEFDRGYLNLQLRGVQLANVEMFSKSDPFYEIQSAQSLPNGSQFWQPVYRSETVKNNLQPKWNECQLSIETLCAGNLDRPLQIQVFDWEKSGKHKPIGVMRTTVKGLLSACLTNGILKLVQEGRFYGTIMCTKAEIVGDGLDPNNAPPRFKTINGVRGFNPQYTEWQKQYGTGAGAAAQPKQTLAYRPPK